MKHVPYLAIIIFFTLIGCSKPEVLTWSYYEDDNYDVFLKKDSEVIIRIGEKIIRLGKIEGDDEAPWEYLRKSNEEPFNGLLVSYYDNGIMQDRCMVIDGLDHGLYEYFLNDGTLAFSSNYEYGVLQGLALDYEDGQVTSRTCFQNGEEVALSICDYD